MNTTMTITLTLADLVNQHCATSDMTDDTAEQV